MAKHQWSDDIPEESGYYWLNTKLGNIDRVEVVHVEIRVSDFGLVTYLGITDPDTLDDKFDKCRWSGPIREPEG